MVSRRSDIHLKICYEAFECGLNVVTAGQVNLLPEKVLVLHPFFEMAILFVVVRYLHIKYH